MTTNPGKTGAFLNDAAYTFLKWMAQIFLPACGTLYFSLSEIWGFPGGAKVVGTITIVDLFLGAVLGFSTVQYNNSGARYDGKMVVHETEDKALYSLEVDGDPQDLKHKDEAVFKVEPAEPPL